MRRILSGSSGNEDTTEFLQSVCKDARSAAQNAPTGAATGVNGRQAGPETESRPPAAGTSSPRPSSPHRRGIRSPETTEQNGRQPGRIAPAHANRRIPTDEPPAPPDRSGDGFPAASSVCGRTAVTPPASAFLRLRRVSCAPNRKHPPWQTPDNPFRPPSGSGCSGWCSASTPRWPSSRASACCWPTSRAST